MVKMTNRIMTGALALLLVAGCGDSPDKVATVNDKPITEGAFKAHLDFKRIPQQEEERVSRALDSLVEREALAQEIEQTDALDSDLVTAELEEFRRQLLISRYFEDYLDDAVTDESVRNFYANHADRYQAESVKAAHILIRVSPDMGEAERQAKLSTAHEAYSKIQQGTPFEEVAKEYSEDKLSAKKGGSLGWLKQGAVAPAFSKKVFDMEVDEVSEPFTTSFGYHIVKVLDGPRTVKQPLEAVEGEIRYELRNEAKKAERKRLLEQARIETKGE